MAVSGVLVACCLFGGYALYIYLVQQVIAARTAAYQGKSVFFFLSLILSIGLFYGILFLSLYITKQFIAVEITDAILMPVMIISAAFAGLLAVVFWCRILSPKDTDQP